MKKHEEQEDNQYYTGPQSLSPVPLHVASAIIRPEDKGKIKTVALEAMEKQANQQMAMLKKQADLILEQVEQIKQRLTISAEIYKADMSFEPVVGSIYHLYERNNQRFISMIAPTEWSIEKKNIKFVATVKLNADRTWDVLIISEAAE